MFPMSKTNQGIVQEDVLLSSSGHMLCAVSFDELSFAGLSSWNVHALSERLSKDVEIPFLFAIISMPFAISSLYVAIIAPLILTEVGELFAKSIV